MFREKVKRLIEEFEQVTGQQFKDWSSYEELEARGQAHNPILLLHCLKDVIVTDVLCSAENELLSAKYLLAMGKLLQDVETSLNPFCTVIPEF